MCNNLFANEIYRMTLINTSESTEKINYPVPSEIEKKIADRVDQLGREFLTRPWSFRHNARVFRKIAAAATLKGAAMAK